MLHWLLAAASDAEAILTPEAAVFRRRAGGRLRSLDLANSHIDRGDFSLCARPILLRQLVMLELGRSESLIPQICLIRVRLLRHLVEVAESLDLALNGACGEIATMHHLLVWTQVVDRRDWSLLRELCFVRRSFQSVKAVNLRAIEVVHDEDLVLGRQLFLEPLVRFLVETCLDHISQLSLASLHRIELLPELLLDTNNESVQPLLGGRDHLAKAFESELRELDLELLQAAVVTLLKLSLHLLQRLDQ